MLHLYIHPLAAGLFILIGLSPFLFITCWIRRVSGQLEIPTSTEYR